MIKVIISRKAFLFMRRCARGDIEGSPEWEVKDGDNQVLLLDEKTYNFLVDRAIEQKLTFDEVIIREAKRELGIT